MNDRNNNIYKEVMLKLYHQVQTDGENSSRLPTLRKLAEEFGCTAPTVLRAVRELVKQDVLIQLKNGDYRTVPQFTSRKSRYIATVYSKGMNLLDSSYMLEVKYHALKMLARSPENLRFSEIRASSTEDIRNSLGSGVYSGVILCEPNEKIIPEVTEVCRAAGLPLGVFAYSGGGTAGDVSVSYDAENDYLRLFGQILERRRRRVLVLSIENHGFNGAVQRVLDKVAGNFEKCVFMKTDSISQIRDCLLRNTGGTGENYDCVVYLLNIFETYETLQRHAPDCLCTMPEFGAWQEKRFRGLVMRYDLEEASRRFGGAMAALLNGQTPENPRTFIPCSIGEIPQDIKQNFRKGRNHDGITR